MSDTSTAFERLNHLIRGKATLNSETFIDIAVLLNTVEMMRSALQKAETVLEGVVTVRRDGDILEVIKEALNK